MHLIHAIIKTKVVRIQKSLVTAGSGFCLRVLRNKVDDSGAEKNFQEGSFVTDTWLEDPKGIF